MNKELRDYDRIEALKSTRMLKEVAHALMDQIYYLKRRLRDSKYARERALEKWKLAESKLRKQ